MIGDRTLVFWSANLKGTDRKGIPKTHFTAGEVSNCSIQPKSVSEDVTNIDYAIAKFTLYAPATTAATACKVTDYVQDCRLGDNDDRTVTSLSELHKRANKGQLYRVIGAKVWRSPAGVNDHVEIVAEVPSGLKHG